MTAAILAKPGWRMAEHTFAHETTDGEFGLLKGLFVSLGLHALLVSPLVLFLYWTPAPSPDERLAVELFGMVSNRQTEEKQLGEQVDRKAVEPQKASLMQRKPLPSVKQSVADSPVRVEKQDEKQEVQREQTLANSTQGADEQQKQQTIQNSDPEMDALRKYAAAATKAIKAKLVYPPEARQAGHSGMTIVAFRVGLDGEIEPGTLAVRRSSGYASLDESALRAARAAAPLPQPPKSMPIVVPINFNETVK